MSNQTQTKLNISQLIQEFLSLCKGGAHLEAETIFQALPKNVQCRPAIASCMAKSYRARDLQVEEGQVLLSAMDSHRDNTALHIHYIAHLINNGKIGEAAKQIDSLGDGIEVQQALFLAKAFEKCGESSLALKSLDLCKDKGRHSETEKYYVKLLVTHEQDLARSFSEIGQMRNQNEACIYPQHLLRAYKKVLGAKMYSGDAEGALNIIYQYASSCGANLSVDQMCVIASDLMRLDDYEKARGYFIEIISKLSQHDEYLMSGRTLQYFGELSRKLDTQIPEQLVEQIILRHLRDLKSTNTSDLIALVDFSRNVGGSHNILAVLYELLLRPLTQSEMFSALMFATLLGDAELLRRFSQKLKTAPQSHNSRDDSLGQSELVLNEKLGVNGYRSTSDQAMLIFGSLLPKALENIVEMLLEKNVSPIVVHDLQRSLHLSGLGPRPESLESSVSELMAFLSEQGFTRIHTMGLSGGGLGALIYADALKAATCIVCSPPSYVPAPGDPSDVRGRAIRRKIEKLNLLEASDVSSRFATSGAHPKTHVYYPTLSKVDVLHAERLRPFDHVTMFPQENDKHAFWGEWDSSRWSKAIDGLL